MRGARIIAIAALGASCATTTEIGALEPRPVVTASGLEDLELSLGPEVADGLVVRHGSSAAIRVRRWRASLVRGFDNATGTREGSSRRRTVRIDRAELALVPRSEVGVAGALAWRRPSEPGDVLIAHGNHAPPRPVRPPRASVARIVFAASLIDSESGQAIARAAGQVTSARQARATGEVAGVVRDGIERLFERLLPELLGQASTR